MQILNLTATEQLIALKSGEISAVDLLEKTIERAETLRHVLNPFALTLYDRARVAAREADKKLAEGAGGRLCGLPVTIKDSQFLAGYRCANGSRTLKDFIPTETCRAVEILEEEDAVIFAKTTCPEFSLTGITSSEFYGVTSNPWDTGRTCGGSSGGAAVAVASGLGAFSLGGDGGGSIRIPSAFCGIVGFKPSFAAIPREPCFPSWYSIVSYGPMTRSVGDARLFFEILNDSEPTDDVATEKETVICSEDLGFAPIDSDVKAVWNSLLEKIAGNFTIESDNPGLPSSVITWAVTATYDAAKHARDKTWEDGDMGEMTQGFIDFGNQFSDDDFEEAQTYRQYIADRFDEMYERNNSRILITPTLGCEAFKHGRVHPRKIGNTEIKYPWLDWAGFLYNANLVGYPACSIPVGFGDDGLPVSIQIQGPVGSDYDVLRIAEKIEQLVGWDNSIVTPDISLQQTA